MLTRQHTQECLSLAFVHALAGRAGVNISVDRIYDYGVDGTLHPVVIRDHRRVESGFSVDFQLKSTVNWNVDGDHVVYDPEVKTYNDLVTREFGANRCILILLCCLEMRRCGLLAARLNWFSGAAATGPSLMAPKLTEKKVSAFVFPEPIC